MNRLAGKIAIVTGASSGIGHADARLFASEGAKVIVSARRQDELDALVEAIARDGGTAVAVAGDVCDENLAQRLVTTALERFRGLDIAFNNAGGVGPMVPLQDMKSSDWHDVLHTNLNGAFVGAKHQIPALLQRGGGSLLFTSSFVGHTVGMPGMSAYAASKAGILGMMKCLAAELGPNGIRVNALLPGGTDTPPASPTPPTPGRKSWPSSRTCTPSSVWPHRKRSPGRRSIWLPTIQASSPARPCWPTVAFPSTAPDCHEAVP